MGIFGTEDMGLEMRRSGADRMNAAWRKVLGYGSGEEFQEGVRELRAVIGERNRTWMEELLRLESVSERIDLCVEKAYESEDHTLFADYLLSFMEEKNEAKKNYYRGLVPGYSRVRMADLGDHTIRKDVWQKEEFHTAGTLTDLGAGITRLDKDVAVQLGLCFGMDRQSVNRWLRFSETEQLYPLILVDAVGGFYLEHFHQMDLQRLEEDPDYTLTPEEGRRRCAYVKEQIDARVEEWLAYDRNKEALATSEKGLGYARKLLMFGEKKGERNAVQEYELRKNLFGVEDASGDGALTRRFREALDVAGEEEFLERLRESFPVFDLYPQGLFRQMRSCMEDIEATGKNYSFYGQEGDALSTCGGPGGEGFDAFYGRKEFGRHSGSDYFRNRRKRFEAEKGQRETPLMEAYLSAEKKLQKGKAGENTIQRLVRTLTKNKNVLERYFFENCTSSGGYLVNLFQGKKEGENSKYNLSYLPSEEICAIAVATGHEEDIGTIMIEGSRWERDLLNPDEASEETDWGGLDLFCCYALRYRDCLIDRWNPAGGGRDPYMDREKTADAFPMMALMAVITRDIQFWYRYGHYDPGRKGEPVKLGVYDARPFAAGYNRYIKGETLFRTKDSNMLWFTAGEFPTERNE